MPFVKGKSGNPSGRPKGSVSLKERLKALLTTKDADEIVGRLLVDAKAGNIKSIELIAEFLGEIGKAVPSLAVQINNGIPESELLDRARNYALSHGLVVTPALPVSSSIVTVS